MFHFQDLASNSPYCLLYNSYIVTSENLLKTRDLFFSLPQWTAKRVPTSREIKVRISRDFCTFSCVSMFLLHY